MILLLCWGRGSQSVPLCHCYCLSPKYSACEGMSPRRGPGVPDFPAEPRMWKRLELVAETLKNPIRPSNSTSRGGTAGRSSKNSGSVVNRPMFFPALLSSLGAFRGMLELSPCRPSSSFFDISSFSNVHLSRKRSPSF